MFSAINQGRSGGGKEITLDPQNFQLYKGSQIFMSMHVRVCIYIYI